MDNVVTQLTCSYVGLTLIPAPPALLVLVSVVHGTVEQEAVKMGLIDEVPVCKACEIPMGHEMVAGFPL